MYNAWYNIVVIDEASFSKGAFLSLALLMALANHKPIYCYFNEELLKGNDMKTLLSHINELKELYPQLTDLLHIIHDKKRFIETITSLPGFKRPTRPRFEDLPPDPDGLR